MAPWTFNVKFSYDTQFIFGSLMFNAREDGDLELLTQAQHQVISGQFTEKLRIIRPIYQHHRHRPVFAQV
jgi:hypothetical protein